MILLPFENITYKTKLMKAEVRSRLNNMVEPRKMFRFSRGSSKPYEGTIEANGFDIKRLISYRNSFLPVIIGTIQSGISGTTIHVKMRMHISVILFSCVWCFFVGIAAFAFLPKVINGEEDWQTGLIPFGMLAFMYAITMGGFKFE